VVTRFIEGHPFPLSPFFILRAGKVTIRGSQRLIPATSGCVPAKGERMRNLVRDLTFGFRLLGKTLGFYFRSPARAVLGIGANTAIFSVGLRHSSVSQPYPNPDQLVMVWSKINGNRNGISAGDFSRLEESKARSFNLLRLDGRELHAFSSDHPSKFRPANHSWIQRHGLDAPFFLGRDFLRRKARSAETAYW